MPDAPDRRETYARAIYETLTSTAERHPWVTLARARQQVWYDRADAAIALADAELRELRAELTAGERTDPGTTSDAGAS